MKELSDEKLVMLVKVTRDADGFTKLVRRHQSGLVAFLQRLAGDDMNIDDIAQTATIRAFQKIDQFRSESSFRTWLFQIAYVEYLQVLRLRKAVDRLKVNVADRNVKAVEIDAGVTLDLKRGLSLLSVEERSAILLCDANGLSHTEAARAMNAPLGTTKTYLKRAREKMRKVLGSEPEKETDEK